MAVTLAGLGFTVTVALVTPVQVLPLAVTEQVMLYSVVAVGDTSLLAPVPNPLLQVIVPLHP